MIRLRVLLLLLLTGLLGACARKPQPDQPLALPPAAEIEKPAHKEEIVLRAMAKGDQVWIDLENHLPHPINIHSGNFAVIDPARADQQILRWDPQTMRSRLPHVRLESGQAVTGILQFKLGRGLVGLRLVFNPRPEAEPVSTEIKPYRSSVFKPPS